MCIRNLKNLVEWEPMTKKKALIIICIVGSLLIIGGILFSIQQRILLQKKADITSDESINTTPAPKEELLKWEDPAGFSFQYPKSLTIDKHDEDTQNYAHVEMTNPDHKGRIIVWGKDTTAATIDAWLKGEKSLKDAVSVDTTLGGNEAKKVMVKEPVAKLITATLDEDIVVYVETDLGDEEYWQGVNDTIVQSFTFQTSSADEAAEGTAGDEPAIEADEEESIE